MISNLITPPSPKKKESNAWASASESGALASARMFVGSMGDSHRERFKKMIELNPANGQSISQAYNVPHDEFISEVKKII